MKIQPRGKNILIEKDKPSSKESEYGIVTPDSVEEEQKAFGTVVAVGPDIKDIKKGDRVVYGAYAGEQIQVEDKGKKHEYRLVEDQDVIAFIQK